ncbi:Uncharacterised protein [Mycobacterium tuberculosis]|uniref:Uncharacterized protein n=2 Tax=Mycobacterium tuberculosis TaxID=1773 RepID=A0A655CMX6_MYCTX|nr:Uncharacterised protein [Mycobacterium tuberculosis]
MLARCSTASAARCASLTRLAPVPTYVSILARISACRTVGFTKTALGAASQSATWVMAASRGSGRGNNPTLVANRTNANNGTQANPTRSAPDSAPSSQRSDGLWCSLVVFTA